MSHPFSALNHFTVPFAMTGSSWSGVHVPGVSPRRLRKTRRHYRRGETRDQGAPPGSHQKRRRARKLWPCLGVEHHPLRAGDISGLRLRGIGKDIEVGVFCISPRNSTFQKCTSRGKFGIRVIFGHRAVSPEKCTFSDRRFIPHNPCKNRLLSHCLAGPFSDTCFRMSRGVS
jgi:hypothetical protein